MLNSQSLLLLSLGGIGFLLLIGTYLRGKITLFQKLYLPASVIGGFVGLIILQLYYFFNGGISQTAESVSWTIGLYAMLPAILIMPIVASAPLGIRLGSGEGASGYYFRSIFAMFAISGLIFALQLVIGLSTGVMFGTANGELYPSLGIELMLGFTGGHGLVGLVSSQLKEAGSQFWEVSQGIASTNATVGLVFGIIIGIIFINFAIRKKWLTINSDDLGDEEKQRGLEKGYYLDPAKQESVGNKTTDNSSISVFAFHISIILVVCAVAIILTSLAKAYQIPVLKSFSAWGVSILVMFVVWGLMNILNIDNLINEKVKNQVASFFTEIAIVSAIVSLPVRAVLDFWQPILTMIVLGTIVTFMVGRILSPLAYKDHCISRETAIFGTGMGVFITGLALLKICDPNLKTPVLSHFSVAYAFSALFGVLVLGGVIQASLHQGAMAALYHSLGLMAFYFTCVVIAIILKRKY